MGTSTIPSGPVAQGIERRITGQRLLGQARWVLSGLGVQDLDHPRADHAAPSQGLAVAATGPNKMFKQHRTAKA